jgi:hypothetical protein
LKKYKKTRRSTSKKRTKKRTNKKTRRNKTKRKTRNKKKTKNKKKTMSSESKSNTCKVVSTGSSGITLSPWCAPVIVPSTTYQTGLKVYNSLTRRLDEFITINGDRHITWYM